MRLVLECVLSISPQQQVSVGQLDFLGGILKMFEVLVVTTMGVVPLAFSDGC